MIKKSIKSLPWVDQNFLRIERNENQFGSYCNKPMKLIEYIEKRYRKNIIIFLIFIDVMRIDFMVEAI